jgi:ElaA protein
LSAVSWTDFSGADARLSRALELRHEVFVVEQQVPVEEEVDGLDPQCVHVLAEDEQGPLATARLRPVGPDRGKVERVAVRLSHRGRGLGLEVMRRLHELAAAQGLLRLRLGAQTHAIGFYEKLGYGLVPGEVFMDAGIPHRWMERPPPEREA